jgi:hypothetical protein
MKGKTNDKLCAIDDSGRAGALSRDATVFCGHCGAKAADPKNVCDPVELSHRK